MEKEPKVRAEEIHLVKIDTVSSKIDTSALKKAIKPTFGIGQRVMHNLEDERIKIELAISFIDNSDQVLLDVQIDFYFHIENLINFYQIKEENHPIFHGSMIATLVGISVSTARGILYEKLQANGIQNMIIPVISPYKLL